jgi:hypothetical protein
MWIKMRVAAAGATMVLAAAGAAAVGGAPSAQASTAACGNACSSPYNLLTGSGEVLGFSGSTVKLQTASTTSSGQDWTLLVDNGNGADANTFVGAGLMPKELAVLYGGDAVVEFETAPDGVPSGQCLAAAISYEVLTGGVDLQPCGSNTPIEVTQSVGLDDTVATDYTVSPTTFLLDQNVNGTTDLISGTTTTFSVPDVLSATTSGSTTTLSIAPLDEIGGVITPGQLWTSIAGSAIAAVLKTAEAHRQ